MEATSCLQFRATIKAKVEYEIYLIFTCRLGKRLGKKRLVAIKQGLDVSDYNQNMYMTV